MTTKVYLRIISIKFISHERGDDYYEDRIDAIDNKATFLLVICYRSVRERADLPRSGEIR